jgi:hypothetical protein
MDSGTQQERKEPYFTPKLTIYGTVEELTKMIGNNGALDGGTVSGKTRTSA